MEGEEDRRLIPIRGFTLAGFRLDPGRWQDFVSQEENMVTLDSFCSSQEYSRLFIHLQPDSGLCAGLSFPGGVRSKVLCVSKTAREPVTEENSRTVLRMQETSGGDALSCLIGFTEEVTCPLPVSSGRWAPGVAESTLRCLEWQKNVALVMKAQVEGHTFLPHPDALRHLGNQDQAHGEDSLSGHNDSHHHDNNHSDSSHHDDGTTLYENDLHDNSVLVDATDRKQSEVKLLHACEGTVVEWAELVSEFLQQDWSKPVLDGLKPLPSEEFSFWRSRQQNLHFLQKQLMSPRVQQVESIFKAADSIYWSTLRDIYRDVQEGVQEAEDIVGNLGPVQQKLEEVEHMEYQQLGDNMAAVMEEVRLLWTRSEFYCKPCRVVVLLQEICNLFTHLSRKFLHGQEVMRSLASDPAPVLADVRLVIWTLKTLKETYAQNRTLLETQNQNQVPDGSQQCTPTPIWDFPSHLVFLHLDSFLNQLHSIQEVFSVSLKVFRLDQTVLSGVSGVMWTDTVQQVYQKFLVQVRLLSDCSCDPTDPEDQNFRQNLDRFQDQVSDLETQLVSVLSRALEDCSEASSAAKVVKMFGFLLDRLVIQAELRPQLTRLVRMVRLELDRTELLFHTHRGRLEKLCRFHPPAAAQLSWIRQLRRRAEEALKNYGTVQNLCLDPAEAQLVLNRFGQILELLLDFKDSVRSDWSSQLDSDCGLVLDHPLIRTSQSGLLEVGCSHKVEEVLRGLRYVTREGGVALQPNAARLSARRDDITQSYLMLSHMASCYNQVVMGAEQVELDLIQDQLQDLNQNLSHLQRNTWNSEGVCTGVQQQQQTEEVMTFYSTVRDARANMDAILKFTQEWAELDLLQRSGDGLLEGGVTEQTCRRIKEEGEQLLRLTQVNRSLYRADESSHTWMKYLDHIDDGVQDGLFQLLLRALHFLSDNMSPQSCSAALMVVHLRLQETGSAFVPAVNGGLADLLKTIISEVYAAAALPPRVSVSRHGNYQASLQLNPELCALEQEVMREMQQVHEEAELLRAGLDRYSHLWTGDRRVAFQEFLTYSRQLAPEELEPTETPPTLKDFQREIQTLRTLNSEVTHLDDVINLRGWLHVDQRPFRTSLLSLIHDWKHMYTDYLLESVNASLQQMTKRGADESPSSSTFPVTETILLLKAAAVELPEHLAAQLQC